MNDLFITKITLSRTVSKIISICIFTQKFNTAVKNDFSKKSPTDIANTLWVKNFVKIALSHFVSKINVFLRFTQKFKMATKVAGKQYLGNVDNFKTFAEIALSRPVSEINTFLCFMQKFKMATKSGGKMLFCKSHQKTLQIPYGSKILSPKVAGKQFLGQVATTLCRYPVGQKFHRNHSISLRFQDKHIFYVLPRNSRWPPKVAGKRFLGKVGQKFRQNRSISFRFRDK